MKRALLLIAFLSLLGVDVYTQVQPAPVRTTTADSRLTTQGRSTFAGRTAVTAVRDTILYPYAKRTSNRGIFINPISSAGAVAQVYDVSAPVVVTGFEFFAYVSNAAATTPVDLICSIYPTTSGLPSGNPIAQTTVRVRANSNTSLAANRQVALFSNPVVVSGSFAVVVENPIDENVTLFSSNWDNGDGLAEYLPALFIGGSWLRASSVNVGGAPFDADFFLHPFVSYDFQHGFVLSEQCLDGNDTIVFTNVTANAYLNNRFLNRAIFDGTPSNQLIQYNFDNGQGSVYRIDTTVIYPLPQKYVIEQSVEHNLWSNERPFIFKDSIDVPPVADFSFNQQDYRVNFSNTSTGVDDVLWSFGDSIYSTLLNPNYRYLRTGNFEVMLIITNGCGSDTATTQITVSPNSVTSPEAYGWQVAPNPAHTFITIRWTTENPVQTIELFDLNGRRVKQIITPTAMGYQQMNIADLPTGLYIGKLMGKDGKTASMPLIKQ